jgi:hypothetical protein
VIHFCIIIKHTTHHFYHIKYFVYFYFQSIRAKQCSLTGKWHIGCTKGGQEQTMVDVSGHGGQSGSQPDFIKKINRSGLST